MTRQDEYTNAVIVVANLLTAIERVPAAAESSIPDYANAVYDVLDAALHAAQVWRDQLENEMVKRTR